MGHDTIVFLGPSLPVDAARAILDADYRPPARRGDVYGVLGELPRRIILIDGLFHGTPSVWQRELLAALDEGVEVWGASSMGALRAAELERYGMFGSGTIFGWYKDGLIDGDDEVALLHGDAESGYRGLSEPLVNLRATLSRAVEDGLLAAHEGRALTDEAKAMFYHRRSIPALLGGVTAGGWAHDRRPAVLAALRRGRVDLKRRDAEGVLRRCRDLGPAPRARDARDVDTNARARARRLADGTTGHDLLERADASGESARLRPILALRWIASEWCRARGLCPPPIGAAPDDDWLRARRVTRAEYERWASTRRLVEWLESGAIEVAGEGPILERIARQWLASWALPTERILDPTDLGFTWPAEHALFVELALAETNS